MTDAGEEHQPIPFAIDEDFLFTHFIQPFSKQDEPEVHPSIDPSGVEFSETVYDKHYYKDKFPLLEDEVCDILEKCSIDKVKKHRSAEAKQTKEQKKGVQFQKKKMLVEFN